VSWIAAIHRWCALLFLFRVEGMVDLTFFSMLHFCLGLSPLNQLLFVDGHVTFDHISMCLCSMHLFGLKRSCSMTLFGREHSMFYECFMSALPR
jgi:hypothetical protein